MKFFKLTILAISLNSIVGCSSMSMFNSSDTKSSQRDLAVLTEYKLEDGFITFKALSRGCTFFTSFKVQVANKSNNTMQIVQTRPDECTMELRTVSLQYSYKHLGLDLDKTIKVENPIITSVAGFASNQ